VTRETSTWEELTAGMTPERKVLAAFVWAAGLANQGENRGSAWDRAMQETLPTLEAMVDHAEGTSDA
jgi:hypothetical protein